MGRLGRADRPQGAPRDFQSSVDTTCLDFGAYVISNDPVATVHTSGELRGARRIQISRGSLGSSRLSSGISGLRIDYSSPKLPVFVGQWMAGGHTLELMPDEEITRVTF